MAVAIGRWGYGPLTVFFLSLVSSLVVFSDVTLGQDPFDDPPTNGTVVDEQLPTDSEPHLVVTDVFGQPCLLATLNATMQVSYQVQEGLVHQTYMAVADIQLPEDVQAQGVCGENVSSLLLQWGNNDTFVVNMTFYRKEGKTAKENATWSMTSLSISYDLSDREVFPGASESSVVTVERHDFNLFTSPEGSSYVCDRDINCHVGTVDRGVDVSFHQVHLAAFGVTSSEFPTAEVYCTETEDTNHDDDFVVPLIVACVLSALVILIVVAYVISRKLQERREQSEYRPMP